MSVPMSPQLTAAAESLGAEHRIELDLQTVVLRATGPHRWDVCGAEDYEGRVYGSVTASDGPAGVLWRYTLRNYAPHEFARPDLDTAVEEIVSDWPEEVDPIELVARAEALLDTVEMLLNDRHHQWNADYATLLGQLAGVIRKVGAVHDHVHNVAMVFAADRDSAVWGRVAELSADTAAACAVLLEQNQKMREAARGGLLEFTPADNARGLLVPYFAAREAEACTGRTAAESNRDDREGAAR
ncbi:hypothetical protein [Nonomuraea sp. NEAU-A123]|uniref:hypothetical protein n=1 Tax=Nonomuraea sp. NEAU-A123 TaxID=2839649 RepID=UPI001BE41C2C|nr:hypothetical protein [Nonomuraea sp. NEAU-A123]MBT2226274.1 hypothetical protein [Nonomuraea sp. NEAU-A123]